MDSKQRLPPRTVGLPDSAPFCTLVGETEHSAALPCRMLGQSSPEQQKHNQGPGTRWAPPTWRHAVTRGNTQLHTFLHLLAGSVSSSVSEETEEPGPLSPAKNRAEERDAVRGPTRVWSALPGASMAVRTAVLSPTLAKPPAEAVRAGLGDTQQQCQGQWHYTHSGYGRGPRPRGR